MFAKEKHEVFMFKALKECKKAEKIAEVPIGAVLTDASGLILARAHNLRESRQRPTAHAELLAIEKAARKLQSWRLENTTLYVTLEPCLMCWGAIILARIPQLVYGAPDPKAGVCGSVLNLHEQRLFNHFPQVTGRVLEKECSLILSEFFKKLRQEKTEKHKKL